MARVVTSNGYEIGFSEAGSGERTPIVFLHGVGSDKSVWDRQLAHFSRERRVLAFDYPGYGESDPAPEGTTREDFAWAIISAMHELRVDRAHICGLSLGGVIAIAMHDADANRCAALVLADTFAVHPQGQAIYERSLALSGDLRAMAEARVDMLLAQPADPEVRSEVVETMARISSQAYVTGARAVWLADQTDRAKKIDTPSLILVGDQDQVTPPSLSERLFALIPNSRLAVIEGAGHLGNLEQPGQFNSEVGKFIREFDEAARSREHP